MRSKTFRYSAATLALGAFAFLAWPGDAAGADYPTTVSSLNPVVYYRLDTSTPMPTEFLATNIGTMGNGFSGEYQTMSSSRGLAGAIAGDPDLAVSITGGSGQQVVVPFSPAYNPSGPFSVEFWAKPANVDSGNHTVACSMVNGQNSANADDRSGWVARHNGTDWQFILGFDHSDGATYYHTQLSAPGTATAEIWQHVVMIYTPDKVSIYVDGLEVATDTPAMPVLPNTGAPLILGDRGYTGWDYNGVVDEFVLYTNALSAAEVLAHYSNGTNVARAIPYKDLVLQKNPALYLRLGEPNLQLPVAVNIGSFGAVANGVYLAGTTPGVPGPQMPAVTGFETTNYAAALDGVNGMIQLPGINLNSDTVTMLCWIKPDGIQPARSSPLHQRKVSEPQVKATGLQFHDDGRNLSYNWEDQGSDYTFNPGFAPPDNAWTFFAVAITPEDAVMYMGSANGLVAATNTLFHGPHDFSGTTIEVGWDNYQATRRYRGAIDEVAIFDKTLTYAQIKSLFDAAMPAILGVSRTPADPVYEGMTVTFSPTVAGTSPSYQWRKNGEALAGKTTATLTLANVVTNDTASYDLVVTSGGKTVTCSPLSLTVLSSPPIITRQPVSGTRFSGGSAALSVASLGSVPLTYQWSFNGTPIPGATTSGLNLGGLVPADSGTYTVQLTNPYGTTNSAAAMLTVAPATGYGEPMMAASPIAYWSFNETSGQVAIDSAGGFDASYSGNITNGVPGPASGVFGSANKAYRFNGSAYLEAPAGLDVNRNNFAISAWIKVEAWDKTWQSIVTKGDASWRLHRNGDANLGSTDAIGFGTTGLKNEISNQVDMCGNTSVADGQWHHIVALYDGASKAIYVDGVLDAYTNAWGTVSANNYPVRIGENAEVTGRQFNGTIDEVALFSRALSAAEIQELYRRGTSTVSATPRITSQPTGQTVFAGQGVNLSVTVAGGSPYSFQWKREGTDIPGEVGPALGIRSASFADAGAYTVVVSNALGTATSQAATVNVLPEPGFANLTNGLMVHLKFDTDFKDSSGRGNDGTPQGSPAIVAGKIGSGALRYNTVVSGGAITEANYVSLGTPQDLELSTNVNFSVSFWIKFVGSPGDLPFLANNVSSMGGVGVTIAPSYNEGGWSWGLNDSFASQPWPGIGLYDPVKNTLNDGNWHHLVHTFDRAGNGTTYLDGAQVHSMSIVYAATWNLDTGIEWNIGQAGGAYAEQGDFSMDDFGLWRRALLPAEAAAIYHVGQSGISFDTYGPVSINAQNTSSGLDLVWQAGTLETADSLNGPWTTVAGAKAPYYRVTIGTGNKFYRVKL
jgi:hypothetical protein